MALKASVREINEAYAAGNFAEALTKCEQSLQKDPVFVLYAMKGHCCVALQKTDEAEKAYAKASTFPVTVENQPQMQKVCKALFDIYSADSKWTPMIGAAVRLIEFAAEKGNTERVYALTETILEACGKSKTIDSAALRFICTALQSHQAQNPQLCEKLFLYFMDILNKFCASGPKAEQSLSAVQKDTSLDPLVLARKEEVRTALSSAFTCLCAFLASHHTSVASDPQLLRTALLYLSLLRHEVLSKSAGADWTSLLSATLLIAPHIPPVNKTLILSYLAEAWFFSEDVGYEAIAAEVDVALSQDPADLSGLLCRSWWRVTQGTPFTAKDDLNTLALQWINNMSDTSPLSADKLLPKPSESPLHFDADVSLSMSLVRRYLCLFVSLAGLSFLDFRGFTDNSISSVTFQATRALPKVAALLGTLRGTLGFIVQLCRVKALATISQIEAATREATQLLPNAFKTTDDKLLSVTFLKSSALHVQWIFAQLLTSLNCHTEALAFIDHITSTAPSPPSWTTVERAWNQLLALVQEELESQQVMLLRDLTVSDARVQQVKSITDTFLLALKTEDALSKDLASTLHLRLGLCHWLLGGTHRADKTGCLQYLMSAAKLDPASPAVFTYLGHYYYILAKDKDRSSKCYLKALGLNPSDREAGVSCSEIFLENPATVEKALKLWEDIALLSPQSYWMHATKGHYLLVNKQYQYAIIEFQIAVEINATDASLWIGLGHSYLGLDQDTAALKTFIRALEFNDKHIVVLCAIGDIERRLCLLPSAIARYKQVLVMEPANVVALKGLGNCALAAAFQNLTIGWTSGAAVDILEGIRYVEAALQVASASSYRSLWKLLGDLYMFSHNLSPYDFDLKTPFHDEPPYNTTLLANIAKAEEAYRKNLALGAAAPPDQIADMWYDVGNALYHHVVVLLQSKGHSSGFITIKSLLTSETLQLLERAREAFIQGIRAFPRHSGNWNGLGCSYLDNVDKQRECFLQSVALDTNPIGHANLAALAVFSGKDKAARDSYATLQQLESNPIYWLGLGNLNERQRLNGSTQYSVQSVFDAYEAAVEVSKPTEAIMGKVLAWLEVVQSSGVSRVSVSDVLHNVEHPMLVYIRRRPVHPIAWAIYAWALEFRGCVDKAAMALRRSQWAVDKISGNLGPEDTTEQQRLTEFSGMLCEWTKRREVQPAIALDAEQTEVEAAILSVLERASRAASHEEDVAVKTSLEEAAVKIASELNSSWNVDEIGYASAFVKGNAYNSRLGELFSLVSAYKVLFNARIGVPNSAGDLVQLQRGIYLNPHVAFGWSSLMLGMYSDYCLINDATVPETLTRQAQLMDTFDQLTTEQSVGELFGLNDVLQLWKAAGLPVKEGSDVSAYLDCWSSLKATDFPCVTANVHKVLGDIHSLKGEHAEARQSYSRAIELAPDANTAIALKIQVILDMLRQYQTSSQYEHLSAARTQIDELYGIHPEVAAVSMLRGWVWILLKKLPKADECVTEARAIWSFINEITGKESG